MSSPLEKLTYRWSACCIKVWWSRPEFLTTLTHSFLLGWTFTNVNFGSSTERSLTSIPFRVNIFFIIQSGSTIIFAIGAVNCSTPQYEEIPIGVVISNVRPPPPNSELVVLDTVLLLLCKFWSTAFESSTLLPDSNVSGILSSNWVLAKVPEYT